MQPHWQNNSWVKGSNSGPSDHYQKCELSFRPFSLEIYNNCPIWPYQVSAKLAGFKLRTLLPNDPMPKLACDYGELLSTNCHCQHPDQSKPGIFLSFSRARTAPNIPLAWRLQEFWSSRVIRKLDSFYGEFFLHTLSQLLCRLDMLLGLAKLDIVVSLF